MPVFRVLRLLASGPMYRTPCAPFPYISRDVRRIPFFNSPSLDRSWVMAIVTYRRLTLKTLRLSDLADRHQRHLVVLQNLIHSRPEPSLCEAKFAAESNNHGPRMILEKASRLGGDHHGGGMLSFSMAVMMFLGNGILLDLVQSQRLLKRYSESHPMTATKSSDAMGRTNLI